VNDRLTLRLLVMAGGALLAAACATPSKSPGIPSGEGYVRYRCADKQEFAVTYQQQGKRALLEAGGWSHLLPLAPSASGAKYSDGKITLWTKGSGASVEESGRTTYRECTAVSKK
jgi:membrane-bound inhibitor of C-type lysozyme